MRQRFISSNFAKSFVMFGCLLVSATALAALDNVAKRVGTVESLSNGSVYIHLKDNVDSAPACSNFASIIACRLADPYCEPAMKIALAAQLSGQPIEFDVSTSCVGNVAKFERLRVD